MRQHRAHPLNDAEEGKLLELLRQRVVLAEFGEHALECDNLDGILTEACRLVGEALSTDSAKVMELQEDGETLLVRTGVGCKPGVVGELTLKATHAISEGRALRTGELARPSDINKETRLKRLPVLADNEVKASANVVIIGGQGRRPFGILQVDSREPRQFTDDDTAFLRSYANIVAAAVNCLRVTEEGRDGEQRLRLALEAGEMGSWGIDLDSGVATGTPRTMEIFGYASPPPAWTYKVFRDHVLPEDREHMVGRFQQAAGTGLKWNFECRIRRADDGEIRWIEVRCGPAGARGDAPPTHLVGIVADITERKQAEEVLRRSNEVLEAKVHAQHAQQESEARFRFATQAGRLGVWELDLRSGELTASAFCKAHFGYDPETAFTFEVLCNAVHVDDRARMAAAIDHSTLTGAEYDIEYRIVRPNGTMGWVQMHAQVVRAADGTVIRMAGISLDFTERVRTEERIRQSQRVEAVGRLTAGVAHDFNNVLQALLGGLELAIDEVQDLPRVRTELEFALQAGQRGARLTSHLLSFARQQKLHPTAFELPRLLGELSHTLERTLGRDVLIRIDTSPGLPLVLADAAHLDSALLNLALNARDAMPHGGELLIEARAVGELVVIAVSDTGAGMAPDVLAQACEPFFSTKGAQGSGLGLSMVQGFARQSGGELRIQSAPDQGTRIEIWLPVAQQPAASAPAPRVQQARGRGRILVVDDDLDVGRVTSAFLCKAGYDVITVGSGDEALAKLSANLLFDALVTDYAMPGMNGADLVKSSPSLPALLITGYAGAEGLDCLPPNVTILRKPFQREDLVSRVKGLIEGATPPQLPGAERTA